VTDIVKQFWFAEPFGPEGGTEFAALLLAIAAHDLRQPLQMMQYVHNSLGRAIRTRPELELMEVSQAAINQMSQRLKDILGALVVHKRIRKVEREDVAVGPLLEQARRENRDIAARKGIGIRVVGTSACVRSDPLLLSVMLRNLLNNAVHYTKPGGRILVGCRNSGPLVRIDVIDTGVGISNAAMPRLFQALTRLEPERSDGLGIGLFIVRKAAELLGHRIDVSSTANRGSRFSIVAPRAT
jgi:signal transduction histidine kinase